MAPETNFSGKQTKARKADHIRICLTKDVNFKKGAGFDQFTFDAVSLQHNALPEVKRAEIDTSTSFLNKPFRAPLLISPMVGGTEEAERLNKHLATAAERLGLGMGVGSQRAMLKDPSLVKTYLIRDVAPSIFLAGNIGGAQLLESTPKEIINLATQIEADALYVHLNPAQELAQPEGDTDWRQVTERIRVLAKAAPFPILIKEVGNGISGAVASRLVKNGVAAIDVAGAGGTNWVKVEHHRQSEGSARAKPFFEWGVPTSDCIIQVRQAEPLIPLIASGGIRTGSDVAKAIALGANLAGIAKPLLQPATESADAVQKTLETIIEELKDVMFLVGVKCIADLGSATISEKGK
ncbi:MAG: type 2 isopentenyl-diphosphate Delta-isomerase [Nanoarchaeota archaeon]|nr:type 2 isopentenyl-diphosphate Delta-isomerase [Nanoarchaeota archaeon]